DTNDRVPPVIAPPFQVKEPEETNRLSLAPIVMEPVAFEKLGLMPDGLTDKLPLVMSMRPLFVCAALARLSVSDRCNVTVPWLSSCSRSVRGPPVPTAASIVAPAALVSVAPAGMFSIAPYDDVISVSTIAPLFVKLLATARTAVL